LRAGDLERMVATHRRAPFGPHPDDLCRLLYFLRAHGTDGKYVIIALPGGQGWRLARVTGRRSDGSLTVEAEVYHSLADAEHAAFTARLRQLAWLDRTGETT